MKFIYTTRDVRILPGSGGAAAPTVTCYMLLISFSVSVLVFPETKLVSPATWTGLNLSAVGLHLFLSLLLLMLGIGTNDHYFSMTTNDFALLAHRLD